MINSDISAYPYNKNYIYNIYDKINLQLKKYEELIYWWNSKKNIMSKNVSRETLKNHFIHSISIIPFINNYKYTIIDIGSGFGLPSIPISLYLKDRFFLCFEKNINKAYILNHILSKLTISNVKVYNKNAEKYKCDKQCKYNIVSKYVYSPLNMFSIISLFNWKTCVFLWGIDKYNEIKLLSKKKDINVYLYDLHKVFAASFFKGKLLFYAENLIS